MDGMEKEKKMSSGSAVRIYPSEIGSWEYCRIKWYFEKIAKKASLPEKESGVKK